MRWFVGEFGQAVLRRDVVLPSAEVIAEVISEQYSAAPEQIEALVTWAGRLMILDPALINLELFDGSADKKDAARRGGSRTVGHFRMEDGRAIIALDQDESSDPMVLTAIVVHELCHMRLLGEARISRHRPDGERLTDLLTVYFGFGIFSTNAAHRFDRAGRGWSIAPQGQFDDRTLNAARNDGYHRLGYLSSQEFGYALSCYCWLRGEADPDWTRHVNPGPAAYLRQGLAYLKRTSANEELPTQRMLGRSVKVGDTTIRVVTGTMTGPGLLGLMVPNPGQVTISDEPADPGI